MIKVIGSQIYYRSTSVLNDQVFGDPFPFNLCKKAFKYTHEERDPVRKLAMGIQFNFKYEDFVARYYPDAKAYSLVPEPRLNAQELGNFQHLLVCLIRRKDSQVVNVINSYLIKFLRLCVENYGFNRIVTQEFHVFDGLGLSRLVSDAPQFLVSKPERSEYSVKKILDTYSEIPISYLPRKILMQVSDENLSDLDTDLFSTDDRILNINFMNKYAAGLVANQLRKKGFEKSVAVSVF